MATTAQVNAFIAAIAPIIQKKCKEHGWGVPSAIIAQAGLESAWGTSGLAKTCYNYWGMKWKTGCGCDYKAYTTSEQRADGSYYQIVSKFRKYPNMESGIDGYYQFIESYSRYKPVMAAKNYTEYATQIKNCGWATSLKYTQNIINTVTKYNLQKYDNGTIKMSAAQPTIKNGSKGTQAKLLQQNLNHVINAGLVEDGIFGTKSVAALKKWQSVAGLTADGIYGKNSYSVMSKTLASE